jgi:hypothetical protein
MAAFLLRARLSAFRIARRCFCQGSWLLTDPLLFVALSTKEEVAGLAAVVARLPTSAAMAASSLSQELLPSPKCF